MPKCPECGGDFEIGLASCPVCGCDLVDDDESEIGEVMDDGVEFEKDSRGILLLQTNDVMSAELLEEALKDQGIPCLVKQNTGSYSGLSMLNAVYKDVKIFVPESALEHAIEVAETIIPDYERPDE